MLRNPARREAFEVLAGSITGEMAAMSHVKVPTVLDVILLSAVVVNRGAIMEIEARLRAVEARLIKAEEMARNTSLFTFGSHVQ